MTNIEERHAAPLETRDRWRHLNGSIVESCCVFLTTTLEHILTPKPRRARVEIGCFSSVVNGDRWSAGDEAGPNTFLAMPYFPFLSSCAGYGNHMSFSKLVESHPDCSLVRK